MRLQQTAILLALFSLTSDISVAGELSFKTSEGLVIIPESSQPQTDKAAARTNLVITKPTAKLQNGLPNGETPASLACVYGLTSPVPGCNINTATTVPKGGWGAIALVDAYYNPYAANDLIEFSTRFNLLPVNFEQVFASASGSGLPLCGGTQPQQGWWDEQVLDIELAHAMAPNAKIYLVEAASFLYDDMSRAIACASKLVADAGGGVVSMSWSYQEWAGELDFDHVFSTPKVVYISSAGDFSAPARYPSSSPYVISAGGTSIQRDANGNFKREVAWSKNPNIPSGEKSGGSGGPSQFEPRPSFQNVVQKIVGSQRGTPDISFNADFATGIVIYSTYSGGWIIAGGTSAASPALAGIINTANHRAASSQDELNYIYQFYPKAYHQYWHDIVVGNNGYPAMSGYDFATGLGSPRGYLGK